MRLNCKSLESRISKSKFDRSRRTSKLKVLQQNRFCEGQNEINVLNEMQKCSVCGCEDLEKLCWINERAQFVCKFAALRRDIDNSEYHVKKLYVKLTPSPLMFLILAAEGIALE